MPIRQVGVKKVKSMRFIAVHTHKFAGDERLVCQRKSRSAKQGGNNRPCHHGVLVTLKKKCKYKHKHPPPPPPPLRPLLIKVTIHAVSCASVTSYLQIHPVHHMQTQNKANTGATVSLIEQGLPPYPLHLA